MWSSCSRFECSSCPPEQQLSQPPLACHTTAVIHSKAHSGGTGWQQVKDGGKGGRGRKSLNSLYDDAERAHEDNVYGMVASVQLFIIYTTCKWSTVHRGVDNRERAAQHTVRYCTVSTIPQRGACRVVQNDLYRVCTIKEGDSAQ